MLEQQAFKTVVTIAKQNQLLKKCSAASFPYRKFFPQAVWSSSLPLSIEFHSNKPK